MDEQHGNQRRKLLVRVVASVLVFSLFVILAVSWVLTQDPTLKWALFVPLVGAVLILPRQLPEMGLEEDVAIRTKLWLSYVRFAYFAIAVGVMLGLPELIY